MSWIVNDGNVPAGKHGCRVPGDTGSLSAMWDPILVQAPGPGVSRRAAGHSPQRHW